MEEIKPGDVVVLKSGSYDMTVTAVASFNGVPTATVTWQDAKGDHQTAHYATVALMKSS